jgi:hypothetical protein
MNQATDHGETTLDIVLGWGCALSVVAGCVLLGAVCVWAELDLEQLTASGSVTTLTGAALSATLIVTAPLLLFLLIYRLALERLAFSWNPDRNLKALLCLVEGEIAAARKQRRTPREALLAQADRISARYAKGHPTSRTIQQRLEEANRQPY